MKVKSVAHLSDSDRAHAALLTRFSELDGVQRVDAFPEDASVVFFDQTELRTQLEAQESVGAVGLQTHVLAHREQLRARDVVECELVFEESRDLHDLFVRNRFSLSCFLDKVQNLIRGDLLVINLQIY